MPDYQLLERIRQLQGAGRLDQAEALCRQLLERDPRDAEALNQAALIAARRKDYRQAIRYFRRAIRSNAANVGYHNNLGNALLALRQPDEAARHYRQVLQRAPDFVMARLNLGIALSELGRPEEAIGCFRQVVAAEPRLASAYRGLASVLSSQGRIEEAIEVNRRVLELDPDDADTLSGYLFFIARHGLLSPRERLEAHRQWELRHCAPGSVPVLSLTVDRDPARRLRIAYVSPDFRTHAVSHFIEPVLAAHDRSRVEVYCYAQVRFEDQVTQRLRSLADHWRSVLDLDDDQAAQAIRDDRVDILIDLAGHTGSHRLKVFARRPAPVQATYLGYFATTGLSAMDYWITDAVIHPQDTPELSSERIYRLDRCWVCYQPPAAAPPVKARPNRGAELIFGSFNDLAKVSPEAIRLWSRILRALPGSRLLLKAKALTEPATRKRIQAGFAAYGIERQRLRLEGRVPSFRKHLALYGQVDIALDTVPVTGATTTADALWMGVPVVTLAGPCMAQRQSASLLTALGREEWIASSEEEYLEKALALARDPDLRAELRAGQRELMAHSTLCDGPGLARALEDAYRRMWLGFLGQGDA
jgi:protein O-GlcNAc transferase